MARNLSTNHGRHDETILITGGAGFIGSHVAECLLTAGYRVRAFDSLAPQVHGEASARPDYLAREVELIRGDICDLTAVRRALREVDAVFHFAARVGVGQSMYAIADYTAVNELGTAVLMQALVDQPVRKLVVASSMSIYGEGLYRSTDGRLTSGERTREQLRARDWELRDETGRPLEPLPTPETKTPNLASVYALGKYQQERLCLITGRAYGIPTVALRFFNVYGRHQALSNPYTGVLAIFASRLLNRNRPLVFEDGEQQRDFVSVRDIARACLLALQSDDADGRVFNIGGGTPTTINEVARRMGKVLGRENVEPEITGEYRAGDIRHCFADIGLARQLLGYEPRVSFDDGLRDLAEWLEDQVATDRIAEARGELVARGLQA